MRGFVISVPFATLLVGSVALAQPPRAPGLTPLPASLPAQCQALAHVPASAQIPRPEISAHVSVANCLAEHQMSSLKLAPTTASIDQMDAAVAPAVAILDGVIATGDPYWMFIAEDAKRDLYTGMIVRQRSTIKSGKIAGHDKLEPQLGCWKANAATAQLAMARILEAHPDVANRDAVTVNVAAADVRRTEGSSRAL